jgi:hypothetical protein
MNDEPNPSSAQVWLRLLASAVALAMGIAALVIAILLLKSTFALG